MKNTFYLSDITDSEQRCHKSQVGCKSSPRYVWTTRLIEHGFTYAPTQYRLYGRRFV